MVKVTVLPLTVGVPMIKLLAKLEKLVAKNKMIIKAIFFIYFVFFGL
jgi:hypothetical protein